MSKNISISDEVYDRLSKQRNNKGARHPDKIGFSKVISTALDAQELLRTIYKGN